MGWWPAPSPLPAVAAVFGAPLVADAPVVPTSGGMVMTDHDELLVRADEWLEDTPTVVQAGTVRMVERLRAALVARAQPDAPTAMDMVTDLHRAVYGDTWARPESPQRVWVMLLDTVHNHFAFGWCGECERKAARAASPGPATPTGDDDE